MQVMSADEGDEGLGMALQVPVGLVALHVSSSTQVAQGFLAAGNILPAVSSIPWCSHP